MFQLAINPQDFSCDFKRVFSSLGGQPIHVTYEKSPLVSIKFWKKSFSPHIIPKKKDLRKVYIK